MGTMSNTGNRSFVFPLPVDPAPEPFTTNRGGWLRDRDDDGFADDVSIRLTVEPGISYPLAYWGDLLDIAARIGCQNVAIPEALTCARGETLPDGVEARALTIEEAHA